jgi:iron complex transport system substrate-binding protein
MTDLGFSIPPEYDDIAGDAFFASFSAEEIALLDVDVLVWLAATDAEIAAIGSSPLREGLTAAIEGREVFVGELLGGAFSFASPLSLGYLLDELVPELAAAADGDPATEVPSAAALGATGDPAGEGDGEEVAATADEQAAMDAWALVFDSAVPFDDKSPHLEDADQLEPSNAAYAAAGEELGGISLDPTGASVDGDAATVTYDVLFGGTVAYSDLTGTISMIDGVWTVTRNDYCGFLSSARTPCEAP